MGAQFTNQRARRQTDSVTFSDKVDKKYAMHRLHDPPDGRAATAARFSGPVMDIRLLRKNSCTPDMDGADGG
jgi:hypothetical protein